MTWNYGDDSSWYSNESGWSSFSGPPVKEENIPIMTVSPAPRAAAQMAADQIKKLTVNHWDDGKWYFHEELDVIVMDPPGHAFIFAFHLPSLSLFRSANRTTNRLCSSSLRTVIDPYRAWIVNAMKNVVPSGQDFLAYERGDQDVMQRRATALRATKVAQAAKPPQTSTTPATESVAKLPELPHMALLDVQKATRTIQVVEITRTLEVDRKQLVAILRSAGAATMKKDSKIKLVGSDGTTIVFDSTALLQIEWTDSEETESMS